MNTNVIDNFVGNERFQVRRRLGAGGMGVVYEAHDTERDQRVALKTLLRLDAGSLYRFKREFRTLADVIHPNLVRLHELISDGEQWFFTMELVQGIDFLRFVCPEGEVEPYDPIADSGLRTDSAGSSVLTRPDPLLDDSGPATEPAESVPYPADRNVTSATRPGDPGPSTDRTRLPVGDTEAGLTRLADPNAGPESADGSRETLIYEESEAEAAAMLAARRAALSPVAPEPNSGPPRPNEARLRGALRQLARALVALHGLGKLHRDLKPSNVLVTRRGRVVVLDFGLSTEMERTGDTNTTQGHIVGTVAYMSPEQAAGHTLTAASDWYAFGVMLYRALAGRLPFTGKPLEVLMEKQRADPPPPSAFADDLPADLAALCMDLLRRESSARPGGEEVLRRLGVDAAPIDPAATAPHSRPFVGREAHLAALAEAFDATRAGKAVATLVQGRSGAGKSALVQRFLDALAEQGEVVILAGRCYEQESVAYKALDTLIDSLSRYLRRLPRADVEALLPRDVQALARVFPVLRRVEAVAEAPRRGQETPDQQELRRRAFAALREMLARIGDRRPLVLYIDDLQWGDSDSAALLCDLLRPPDPPILLLLCCYRSEYAEVSPCLRRLLGHEGGTGVGASRRELRVDALLANEARDLALTLLGQDDDAARTLAQVVVRESGGSPYFVYELVQFFREGGDFTDSMAMAGTVTLDDVLWRRIGRMPAEARALLEVLAVAGQPLRQASACRVCGLKVGSAGMEALALLRSAHMARSTGPGTLDDVECFHDRIRETVANHLPARRVKELHGLLARELEATANADPETLAVHFEASDQPEPAGRFYVEAAANAAEALAFERAAHLYRRALELLPADDPSRPDLRVRLGDALANAGRGTEAAEIYLAAAEGAEPARVLDLRRLAGYQYLISGRIDEGLASFREILDRVGMPLPSTPSRALVGLLRSRLKLRLRGLKFRERPAEAIAPAVLELIDISRAVAVGISVVDVIRGSDYQTRNLLLALDAGEPKRIALALGWEAVHTACNGLPAARRTARLIAAADELSRRLDDPHAIGMSLMSAGAADFLESRFRMGVDKSDRGAEILRGQCTGVMWELDTAHIFGLWGLFYLGQLAELSRRTDRLFREARERGDRYLEATPGPFVGTVVRLAADDVEGARGYIREVVGQWSQRGFHIQHLNGFYGNSYADLYAGDADAAWSRVVETMPQIEGSLLLRLQQVRLDVLQVAGRCAVAAAAASAAPGPLLREAQRYARRLARERVHWADGMAQLIRAGAASVRGDRDTAARLLAESVRNLDAAEMALFAAAARRRLGQLRGGDEGRALIADADAWLHGQGVRDVNRLTDAMAPFARDGVKRN